MTNLNRLFMRYFMIAIISILVVLILVSNYTSTIFFTDFLTTTYEKTNEKIVENFKILIENKASTGFYQKYLQIISADGTIELYLYQNDIFVLSAGPKEHYIGPDISHYKKYFKPEEVLSYQYIFTLDNNTYTVLISRLKDIHLVKENLKYLHKINIMYLGVFLFAILLASILSATLSKRFNKPIITIRENVKYIKKGQYRHIKPATTKAKELKQLSDEISLLAISKENEENIRKRLSSDIVHELKTPITALSANLEAILDGIYKADSERIKVLLDQTNRLSRLVNGLSKLTMIETNTEQLKKEKINLSKTVKDIVVTFEPAIKEKGLACISNIQEDIYMEGDDDKLLQGIVNIVSNALKYTEKGAIKIELYKKKDKATLVILDTGIGIDQSDLPYVFERFYRSDESRSRKTGGSGIGLAITKAIIQAHDGEISVESIKGKGSSFIVTLNCLV